MKRGRIIVAVILVIFLVLQLIRPERNLGESEGPADMLLHLNAPAEIAELFRTSCYDCHSNKTSYPWYSKISPLSWVLNGHIKKGKEAVNFSQYAAEGKAGRIAVLSEICEVLDAGSMPLKSYLMLHREAVVNDDESALLCDWTESESLKILQADRPDRSSL